MKRRNPFSEVTAPCKRPYQKLHVMTDEEIKNACFNADQLIRLINEGASTSKISQILTYHSHLIHEVNHKGRTVLMSALHKGKTELVKLLLQKDAKFNEKSTTKFKIKLTPMEFVQKTIDDPYNKFTQKYINLKNILNDYQNRSFSSEKSSYSSEVVTLENEELATRLVPTVPNSLTEQLNNEFSEEILGKGFNFEASFERSALAPFLPGYAIQNRELVKTDTDLSSHFNNSPLVTEHNMSDCFLYDLDVPVVNQSNLDYLIENFSDLPRNKP